MSDSFGDINPYQFIGDEDKAEQGSGSGTSNQATANNVPAAPAPAARPSRGRRRPVTVHIDQEAEPTDDELLSDFVDSAKASGNIVSKNAPVETQTIKARTGVRIEVPSPTDEKKPVEEAPKEPKELTPEEHKAVDVLESWIAAEVLMPVQFSSLKDITSGRERDMANLDLVLNNALPWEADYPDSEFPYGTAGYGAYDVVLGTIATNKAVTRLVDTFGSSFGEYSAGKGISLVACLRVDSYGCIDGDKAGLHLSAYGWGLRRVFDNDFRSLSGWRRSAVLISDLFEEEYGARFKDKPIDKATVVEIYYWLLDRLRYDQDYVSRPSQKTDLLDKPTKIIGHYRKVRPDGQPIYGQKYDVPITNSFFMDDLIDARDAILYGDSTYLLDKYMGVKQTSKKVNILENEKALETLLRPKLFPKGKWPHSGRNQLVTMQQATVNYALHPALEDKSRMIACNGPPGTGKTTFLKDMAAAIIVQKAEAMAAFAHPRDAFRYQKDGAYPIYELHPSLLGFEILITSSNNKAVENVSGEWPDEGAVADDVDKGFFPGTAKHLHEKESWGMISAALGNMSNRLTFKERFYYNEDWGVFNQLKFAAGRSAVIENKKTGETRMPHSIQEHRVARGPREAAARWYEAREEFVALLESAKATIDDREAAAEGSLDRSNHEELHTSSPWFEKVHHKTREDLFEAAMKLNRAFIEAAAPEMLSNMAKVMNFLSGRFHTSDEKLYRSVLSSLFLMVPIVSTTFASVGRMLKGVPRDSIGWLFVDEAGQTTPQAVIGALMRSKKAVIIGDPIQVEPVVPLMEQIVQEIAKDFGISAERYMAPWASTQTMADEASDLYAEYPGDSGIRKVGIPLLAHRRCAEPMFSISNSIGYGGLMVNAKRPGPSPIRDAVGPSRWIHVKDVSGDRWSPAEGDEVIKILRQIVAAKAKLDVYLISPFRQIEQDLKNLVVQEHEAIGISFNDAKELRDRIGTIHKVQGREAEAVIMVLGSQGQKFKRSREWAGGRPNIPNVAVTRAKEVLYIVGNRDEWSEAGYFAEVSRVMQGHEMSHDAQDFVLPDIVSPSWDDAEQAKTTDVSEPSIFDMDLGFGT